MKPVKGHTLIGHSLSDSLPWLLLAFAAIPLILAFTAGSMQNIGDTDQ